MTENFVGDPEEQLLQVGSESSKVSVDHILGLRAALEAGIEVFRAVARDPGLGGESGKAASRVFGKHAEEAVQLSETIDKMRKTVGQVEEARGRARELYDALPPKEAPWEQQAAVAAAAGGGKGLVTFFTSFGNTTEAASQGVVAGTHAVNALNNSYADARRAKAQEALNGIHQDMKAAADQFAKANQAIGGTPPDKRRDHKKVFGPDSTTPMGVPTGASSGTRVGGFPSGGGWSGDGYGYGGGSAGGGASGSVSGGGGLVPLPAGVDPSRVPEGHYGTYEPGVVGPDGVPVVRYHPLPDHRGVGPGGIDGIDGRIDPDGPVSSGTTDFGSGLNLAGGGSGVGGSGEQFSSGGSGLVAGAGSVALLGGAGLVSRGGLTGGGLGGSSAGAGAGFRGASLGSGAGGGAGVGGAGAGAAAGSRAGVAGVGGSGALGEGSGARGAGATGAAGGAGKGGMSMMGGQPMGAQSGEKKNQPGSLGLIAPQLEDDDEKPVMPPSAGAGSRERH